MMNADELAAAGARAYIQLKATNYARDVDDSMMMLQFVTDAGHQIYGVVEGRQGIVGCINEVRETTSSPITAVIFNADARASRVRRPLDNEDSIIDCLITIVVVRDQPPAYRCYAYYPVVDGLQFEQSEVEFATIQDVVLDLNRAW